MKLNTIVTLLAMTTLATTEVGLVKLICWGVLFINFVVFALYFDRLERR